mgnify:CR=1 FL=1
MWKKRKPPYLLFFLFLLLCILTGYYFSGIFLEPGLALSNINSRLEYIISHPLPGTGMRKVQPVSQGLFWRGFIS